MSIFSPANNKIRKKLISTSTASCVVYNRTLIRRSNSTPLKRYRYGTRLISAWTCLTSTSQAFHLAWRATQRTSVDRCVSTWLLQALSTTPPVVNGKTTAPRNDRSTDLLVSHHETFYATTATVVPVLYIAFVLEFRQLQESKIRYWSWILFMVLATMTYAAVLIVVETISLLVLSGSIHDTSQWRSWVVILTVALHVCSRRLPYGTYHHTEHGIII